MSMKMRRGKGGCSLRDTSCRGGFFGIFGCLFIGKRNRKAVHISDEKESPIKKIEGSLPNSSDEK